MTQEDHRDLENRALRERLVRLFEANLRINESLDFDTVLQGVLDSACTLTGARYGVITLVDQDGGVLDFLTKGMTPEEAQGLWELPGGQKLFDYLSKMEESVRAQDFHSYIRAQGLPEFDAPMDVGSSLPYLAAPVRNRGEVVGIFFLGEKDIGQEFTPDDEDTLVMFATHAAMVIANARRYRDEQRARADLETLIDTSPVGVVVFDAQSGAPTSFNREALRIGEYLLGSMDLVRLLEVMTVRRADGREVSLGELSMAQVLSSGETVRAEEVVLSVPSGRSVTVLVNATPIRSESGTVASFVATMQDLTPLQETERLRAEFLGMVSHELRTPLTSVKGSVATLLDPSATLNPTEMRQFLQIIDTQTDRMRSLISDLLDVARIETGALSVSPEPTDMVALVDEARRTFEAAGGKHSLQIELSPDLPWVMADRPRMGQVLGNLMTNAARHSSETSSIKVSMERNGFDVVVSVSDRGRGIPAENLPHLFQKFSRVDGDSQRDDTGLGLAICKGIVEAHGGRIWAESDGLGLGARFTFTLPTVEEAGFVSPVAVAARVTQHIVGTRTRILAVDDDPQALRYVREALTNAGYLAFGAANADEALNLLGREAPELVLLDLMLPGTNGIEFMEEIRNSHDVPVIFLSAYGQEELVARAFDRGAADYVVKPFSATELSARIRAALRRQAGPALANTFVQGDLEIDYADRKVTIAGSSVRLTAIEFRTLAELSINAGRVLTYAQLLRRVWRQDEYGDVRPMRTVISSLRRKLGDNLGGPKYIVTEPRVGYGMVKEQTEGEGEQPV